MKIIIATLFTMLYFIVSFLGVYHLIIIITDLIIAQDWIHKSINLLKNVKFNTTVVTLLIMIAVELIREKLD
jgi:hypothetical protein